MITSASAILTQLETVLGTAIGASNVSHNSYDVLDLCQGSRAIVIRPGPISQEPMAFGRTDEAVFTFRAEGFVKHLGDYQTYMNAQWQFIDDVMETLSIYDDLSDSCDNSICRRVEPLEHEWNIGGSVWQQINFYVEATVYGR